MISREIVMQRVLYNQKTIIPSIRWDHQIPRIYISDIVFESRKILRVIISLGYYLSLTSSEDILRNTWHASVS